MHLGISHVSLRRAALFGWPSVGVLQMFKCATRRDPTDSLLSSTDQNDLQRPRTPGGVEHLTEPQGH